MSLPSPFDARGAAPSRAPLGSPATRCERERLRLSVPRDGIAAALAESFGHATREGLRIHCLWWVAWRYPHSTLHPAHLQEEHARVARMHSEVAIARIVAKDGRVVPAVGHALDIGVPIEAVREGIL